MARQKKPAGATAATEAAADAPATAAPAAPQAPETTGAVGGVAAPSAAPVDPQIETEPALVRPTHGPEGFVVVVTGPAKGRWRIGRKFGPEPVSIPAPDLTEAEMDALAHDPELTCQFSSVDPNF